MNIVILLVISTGFLVYYRRAIKRQIDRIDEFFLAGRNIGKELFAISTWSNSLGFGNSMFVAIWAGYSWGLSGIWIQGFWAIGMILYGRLIPFILEHTDRFTLHGYLGTVFGKGMKGLTAAISLIGLLICIGFEITFSGQFFAATLGNPENAPILVLLLALLLATFCSIGGYRGNVALDRICNIFACLSMTIFLFALIWHKPEGLDTIQKAGMPALFNSFVFPNISIYEFTGFLILCLFQIIDMTNWQTVSANSLPKDKEALSKHIKDMRKAINRSAIAFMCFPAIVGTLIGFYFHTLSADVGQSDLLIQSVAAGIPQDFITRTLLLSGLLFGFLSSSLACTNSWLLASVQTLSWDMFDFKTLKAVSFNTSLLSDKIHIKIVQRARIMIYVVGGGGTALMYYIATVWDQFFSLQFMMFGAGLAMLPAFLYASVFKKTSELQNKTLQVFGLISVSAGFSMAILMFIYSIVFKNSNVSGLIPPTVLLTSFFIFSFGIILNKRKNA